MMGILERLRRLVERSVNTLLDELIDPGAAIDELLSNMEDASREARQQVIRALAEDGRQARHREALAAEQLQWSGRAERAVRAGDERLAKEALQRAADLGTEITGIDAARAAARGELRALEGGLRELDGKLAAVRARRETLKEVMRARARGEGAADRYDRIVSDVDEQEAEAELGEELGDSERNMKTAEVRDRIERLETEREVDARLAALKDRMKKR